MINSRIKDIYIELPGYKYNHRSRTENFIGRIDVKERLLNLLTIDDYNDCPTGVYLVAGYRGVGKTSLVEYVIDELNKPNERNDLEKLKDDLKAENLYLTIKKYTKIHINLSQDNVKDLDILRLLAISLEKELLPILPELSLGRMVLSQLNLLITRINSIYKETSMGEVFPLNEKDKAYTRTYQYDKISIKDIERELVEILDNIHECREHDQKIPYFIVIVDELDKIEPNFLYDAQSLPNDELENQIHGINKVRKRQEVIAKILSNLKSFLNIAKAKFVFIGGREMYDAALADVADRDSFYSSIFHDCLYVNSFFKDKIGHQTGITKMTEAYLCQIILKEKSKEDLKLTIKNVVSLLPNSNITDQRIKFKIISLLQNYIIFLTYRSNGLPKKLMSLIENDLVKKSKKEIDDIKNEAIGLFYNDEKDDNNFKFYLKFSFIRQYEIGLTSNLYRPYLIIHSRYMKTLNDRLLYSSAYVIDFLLKYHPYGFSWKNLESIPDIILVNKDPNLRPFIKDVMEYLQGMYVRQTISGMHEFKYYSRVTAEISYLCKVSDASSAAFNFTLDESLHIKRYYLNRLRILERNNTNIASFDFSVNFIQSTLGDLYFYDSEYDEAILYYSKSIEHLHQLSEKRELSLQQLIIFVKNKLKLGLAFQKMHNFDRAYVIYRSLVLKIPALLNQNINNITINRSQLDKTKIDNDVNFDEKWEVPLSRLHILIQPHVAILETIEKDRIDGITYDNLLRNEGEVLKFIGYYSTKQRDRLRMHMLLSDYYLGVGNLLYYKNMNYIPLFEKLKKHPIRLDLGSLDYFAFLDKVKGDKVKGKVQIDEVKDNNDDDYNHDYNPSISACIYYRWSLNQFLLKYEDLLANFTRLNDYQKAVKLLSPPMCNLINHENLMYLGNLFSKIGDSLLTMVSEGSVIQNFTNDDQLKNFEIIIKLFKDNEKKSIENGLNESESKSKGEKSNFDIAHDLLEKYEKAFETKNGDDPIKVNLYNCYDFNRPILMYYIASQFFLKAGIHYSYGAQMKKSVGLIKDCFTFFLKDIKEKNPKIISYISSLIEYFKDIAVKYFNALTWASNVATRPQILKYREILEKRHDELETPLVYANLSTTHEAKEIIIMVEEILILSGLSNKSSFTRIKNLISPYDNISNMLGRTLDLKFKGHLLYEKIKEEELDGYFKSFAPLILDQYCKDHSKKPSGSEDILLKYFKTSKILFKEKNTVNEESPESRFKKELEGYNITQYSIKPFKSCDKIIIEGLFCFSQILKTLNVFGHTYMSSYSYLANAHSKMASWCLAYRNYCALFGKEEIDQKIQKILGSDNVYLEHNYHYELAIKYYYQAIEAHKGGKAYQNLTENLSFLEDDYNDNLMHFSAASERFRINTGVIRKDINKIKKRVKYSKMYNYNNHFVDEEE